MLLIFFVVRNVTIYIREIYMIVFERISCVYLVSARAHLGSVLDWCWGLFLPVYIGCP